jgi:hypothetical protein
MANEVAQQQVAGVAPNQEVHWLITREGITRGEETMLWRDHFKGWNCEAGHHHVSSSMTELLRMSGEELEADAWLRGRTMPEAAEELEQYFRLDEDIQWEPGLCKWPSWEGLRFERAIGLADEKTGYQKGDPCRAVPCRV